MLKRTQRLTAFVALIGLLVPQFALGATPGQIRSAVRDIQLQQGGSLQGQLLTMTGQGKAHAKMALVDRKGDVRRVETDAAGKFRLAGLRGGAYQLIVADGSVPVRVWAEGTAPPHAQNELLVLDSNMTARGQEGALGLLTNPWFLAAGIAAAIAIPIALDDGS